MSSSALSHAVAALEARLGVRLFNRTTRSVALSAEGEQFVTEITPALAAIRSAIERIDETRAEPTGVLRLNLTLGAARMILAPLIFEYRRRYPQVAIDMVTQAAMVDIVGQGFDAGVRLEEFVPPDMIAVPITRRIRSIVVGSPGYFAGGESGQRRLLTYRSTAASAGALGAERSTAGSLNDAERRSRSMSRGP
jgi:DNA-binding transcriptional LysR family regulator